MKALALERGLEVAEITTRHYLAVTESRRFVDLKGLPHPLAEVAEMRRCLTMQQVGQRVEYGLTEAAWRLWREWQVREARIRRKQQGQAGRTRAARKGKAAGRKGRR
jgi:hypothetical protein